jgi:hypothetical protein
MGLARAMVGVLPQDNHLHLVEGGDKEGMQDPVRSRMNRAVGPFFFYKSFKLSEMIRLKRRFQAEQPSRIDVGNRGGLLGVHGRFKDRIGDR